MFNQKAFFPALHYFLFLKNAHENNSVNPKLKTILLPYCQKDTYLVKQEFLVRKFVGNLRYPKF